MRRGVVRVLIGAAIGLLVVLVLAGVAVTFYTDILWYSEVGFLHIYWTRLSMALGVRGLAALLGAGLLFLNLWLVARQLGPVRVRRRFANIEIAEQVPPRFITAITVVLAVLGGWWLAGLQFSDAAVLRAMSWARAATWGVTDPLFGHDVAFFVFTLPFIRDLLGFLTLVTLWAAVLVALGHVVGGGIRWDEKRLALTRPARLHLGALAAALLLLLAAGSWVGGYLLAVDGTGVGGGVGYTDVHARLPAARAMAGLSLVAAGTVLYGVWRGTLFPPIAGLGGLLAGALLIAAGYPAMVQKFQVEPNELSRESPYIRWNLDFTRRAWALDALRRQHFAYRPAAEPAPDRLGPLFERLPLWDTEPLQRAFNEVQSLFPYYGFVDVDFDRYGPPGREQQVAIGVREFRPEGLEPASRTWQSLHLNPRYIRGRGAVVAPARPTTEGRGTHERWVQNVDPIELQPDAPEGLRIAHASIFYGETMDGYVVVIPGRDGEFTGEPGADYPRGVPLSSFLRTVAFAWRFGDETLLFAREITPESRLVFRRSVRERVETIAPFLLWDSDPLPVIFQGRIVWLLDGYTYSSSYPMARAVDLGGARLRYLRNSVKAVVDAVTGEVAFYRLDAADPVLATYERLFPGLVRPLDAMPAEMRRHLRYPDAALLARSRILQEYHLDSVEAFYSGQNVWQRPHQVGPAGAPVAFQPVRALMPAPLADTVEYLTIVPYIASGRQNMTAFLVARNDERRYGQLTLFEFPRDQQIPGPAQVQAMIEQDPIIAPELSLLRQRGSQIANGKLRVIPLDSSVLYVQPFFLSADENPIPEIWRVVVSDGRGVAMGQTLQSAVAGLDMAVGELEGLAAPASPMAGGWPRRALRALEAAEARLRAGDWAGYGRALQELRTILEEVERRSMEPEP